MANGLMPKLSSIDERTRAMKARENLDVKAFNSEVSVRQKTRLGKFQAACPDHYAKVGATTKLLNTQKAELEIAIKKACPQEYFERELDRLLSAAVFCAAYYGVGVKSKKAVIDGTHITGYATAEAVRAKCLDASAKAKDEAKYRLPACEIKEPATEAEAVKAKA